MKVFESSRHVCHFHVHPEEYKNEVATFLQKLGLLLHPDNVPEYKNTTILADREAESRTSVSGRGPVTIPATA